MPTQITFQTTESIAPNPFHLWQIEADRPPDGESFGIDDEAVWSISLPRSATLAEQSLTRQLNTTTQRRQVVGVAGQFLQTIDIPDATGLAFDIRQGGTLTGEEDILLTTMATYSQFAEAESFAFDWLTRWRKPISGWHDTLDEFRQFMEQVVTLLKPTIRIETDLEHVLLAQTLLRANGTLETVWQRRVEPAQMALHRQSTQLTLETRQSLAFFLAQVSAGAVSLAGKFYVAQWVALPAAYRFVTDVVRRAKEGQLLVRMKALQAR